VSDYALGYADVEHDRLIRQAQRLQVCTEAFFRESGIGQGLRVLDLGSGIGDVSMLVASIVGPTGEPTGWRLRLAACNPRWRRMRSSGRRPD
jgi:hypothetical protein